MDVVHDAWILLILWAVLGIVAMVVIFVILPRWMPLMFGTAYDGSG